MNIYMIKIEALLFACGEGITYQKLAQIMDLPKVKIRENVKLLKAHYDRLANALEIVEYADKVQIAVRKEFSEDIEKLYEPKKSKQMSKSTMEVLSIIAYNQNITKASIEHLRGVNCDRLIISLIDEGYIRAVKDPNQARFKRYVTTEKFLKKFGLKSLNELPDIHNMEKLQMKLGEVIC